MARKPCQVSRAALQHQDPPRPAAPIVGLPWRRWGGDESKLGDKAGLLLLSIDNLVNHGNKRIVSIGRLRHWLEEEDFAKRWTHHPLLTDDPWHKGDNQGRDDEVLEHHRVILLVRYFQNPDRQ